MRDLTLKVTRYTNSSIAMIKLNPLSLHSIIKLWIKKTGFIFISHRLLNLLIER